MLERAQNFAESLNKFGRDLLVNKTVFAIDDVGIGRALCEESQVR